MSGRRADRAPSRSARAVASVTAGRSLARRRPRILVASVVVAGLGLVACTGGGNGDDEDSTTSTSTSEPGATTTAPVEIEIPPVEVTPPPTTAASGRSTADVLPDELDGGVTLVPLPAASAASVGQQFLADERLAADIVEVDARTAQLDGEPAAAVVAVALTPDAALDAAWRADFEAAVTADVSGAVADHAIGTVTTTRFRTTVDGGEVVHLLWSTDNVYLLVSGTDPEVVDAVAFAVLDEVAGPFPTTTTVPPPPPTDPVEGAVAAIEGGT